MPFGMTEYGTPAHAHCENLQATGRGQHRLENSAPTKARGWGGCQALTWLPSARVWVWPTVSDGHSGNASTKPAAFRDSEEQPPPAVLLYLQSHSAQSPVRRSSAPWRPSKPAPPASTSTHHSAPPRARDGRLSSQPFLSRHPWLCRKPPSRSGLAFVSSVPWAPEARSLRGFAALHLPTNPGRGRSESGTGGGVATCPLVDAVPVDTPPSGCVI